MKRLLSLMTVCALFCAPVLAQDEESAGNYPELSIITRVDAYPFSPSVYTLLEGSLGDHLSYSVQNLWVNDDIRSLYANTFRADEMDWCLWAYLSLDLGNWHIIAGKDYIRTGGFEVDEYDYDQYWQMTSNFWNNTQVYQYGGAVKYVLPSESDEFMVQVLSSPFSGKPFEGKLLSYNLEWVGEHGPWSTIWSVTGLDYDPEAYSWGDKLWLLSAGNQFELSDSFNLGVDYMYRFAPPLMNAPGAGESGPFHATNSGHNVVGRLNWRPLGWLEAGLKGVYETSSIDDLQEDLLGIPEQYWSGSACLRFYPLKEKDDLRIHALAGMNNLDGFFWGAGITYNFPLTQTLLKRRAK